MQIYESIYSPRRILAIGHIVADGVELAHRTRRACAVFRCVCVCVRVCVCVCVFVCVCVCVWVGVCV